MIPYTFIYIINYPAVYMLYCEITHNFTRQSRYCPTYLLGWSIAILSASPHLFTRGLFKATMSLDQDAVPVSNQRWNITRLQTSFWLGWSFAIIFNSWGRIVSTRPRLYQSSTSTVDCSTDSSLSPNFEWNKY